MRHSPKKRLYVSRRSVKNLWQTYQVFSDRVELRFWFAFRTLVIPLRIIEDIRVRHASILPDRSWGDPPWFRTLKLDWPTPLESWLHVERGHRRGRRLRAGGVFSN